MAKVIPLYKGRELDQVINYRPISLLITISKVLEKIVYIHVYKFLQDNKILYNSQYGFHSKHSCEQTILELIGNVIQAKDKGMHTAALFLDLSKPFDTLNHEVLLKKLERYGIRGICNDWFGDYLSNRSLKVKIQTANNEIIRSDNFDISYGTTQGSCLGPLLFIIFMNDIYLLPTFSKIILFADDTTLINSCKNVHFLKYSLEHDMSILTDWYRTNQLSLNINKTILIKFWPDLKPFTVKIGDVELNNSNSTKFLGMMVDECLTWNAHVGNLYSKIRANKMLLVNAKHLLPTDALRKIYFAHIYTHLTYSLVVWGLMIHKSSYNSLYKLQKECVKLVAKVPKSSSVEPILDHLNLIRLSDLIENELKTHKLLPESLIELFQKNGAGKCTDMTLAKKAHLMFKITVHSFLIGVFYASASVYIVNCLTQLG